MTLLDDFRSTFDPDLVIPMVDDHGVRCLSIKETGAKASFRELRIIRVPDNCFGVRLDFDSPKHLNRLTHFTNKSIPGLCCRPDGVVFQVFERNVKACLVELKSSKPSEAEARAQLEAGEVFIRYIEGIYKMLRTEVAPLDQISVKKRVFFPGPVSKAPVGGRSRP